LDVKGARLSLIVVRFYDYRRKKVLSALTAPLSSNGLSLTAKAGTSVPDAGFCSTNLNIQPSKAKRKRLALSLAQSLFRFLCPCNDTDQASNSL